MRTRKLGRTGFEVSEIGFGAWGLGGSMWLGVPDETGRKAVSAALDSGVTFFDTALAYGDGHSERVLAATLPRPAARPDLVVATKIPPKNRLWPARADVPIEGVFPPGYIVECVEKSLGNLGVEALQVEQFHVWHDNWLGGAGWDDTRAAMLKLTEQGKVLHWGVSINDHAPDTALRAAAAPLIETVQVIYNIYDRSPERELFDVVAASGTGVIVRVPLDEGSLTGRIGPDTRFPRGDWRERYFRGGRRAEAAEHAGRLSSLLGDEARALPELALRFCVTRSEVSTVIVGMRRPEHATANAAVSDGRRLSPALLERLAEHAWEKNWYGP